jgi:hypothetical protein
MGSGHFAAAGGFGKAASVENINVVDEKSRFVISNASKDRLVTAGTQRQSYTVYGLGVGNNGILLGLDSISDGLIVQRKPTSMDEVKFISFLMRDH